MDGMDNPTSSMENPLRAYFDSVTEGPGIWKWLHYFDIYHRHFAKFIGKEVTLVEVGVYGGGSLAMWRQYFGPRCQVHGVDIEPACQRCAAERISVHIGDQSDRAFWQLFRQQIPSVDVFIDDGGHTPEQQRITLEEMLPHVTPGGVYLCEDIHGVGNPFSTFVHSLADKLNAREWQDSASTATVFQASIHSFHFYPYIVAIEKATVSSAGFVALKRGSDWL